MQYIHLTVDLHLYEIACLIQSIRTDSCYFVEKTYYKYVREHPTEKLWVDCLVKTVLLALIFLHAERNEDVILQQHCLKGKLTYLFVARRSQKLCTVFELVPTTDGEPSKGCP